MQGGETDRGVQEGFPRSRQPGVEHDPARGVAPEDRHFAAEAEDGAARSRGPQDPALTEDWEYEPGPSGE